MQCDPAIYRQKCFHPPYCPNEQCVFHDPETVKNHERLFYRSKGWDKITIHPYWMKRYQCKSCGKQFGYSYFKLDYRCRKRGLNAKIFSLFTCAVSNRQIGRQVGCTEHMIRQRIKKMAQWGLLKHTALTKNVLIDETIVYDGIENFASSQYDPNNIQQAIGAKTLFIYDFNFAPLNRKGKMSERQKRINAQLEETVGRYSPRAIRTSTKEIFARLYEKKAGDQLEITSDEHFQYDRAVRWDLAHLKILHTKISSKDARNYQNLLFPINHSDLLTRQHIGAFRRETICFSKTHSSMILKFALYTVWKNYFRSLFVKPHVRRPEAHIRTPAMELGITQKPLEFHEFFDVRPSLKHMKLNREWECFYHEVPTYVRTAKKAA